MSNIFNDGAMLQRIQSIYLSLTTILPLLLFKGDFLKISDDAGRELGIRFSGIFQYNGLSTAILIHRLLPLSALITIIPVLSLFAIFLFGKRKIQLKIVMLVIVVTVVLAGLIIYYSMVTANGSGGSVVPGIKIYLVPVILISAILAYRGIRRDENLVSSYHRLR